MSDTSLELQKNKKQKDIVAQLFVNDYVAAIKGIEKQYANYILAHTFRDTEYNITAWCNLLMLFYVKQQIKMIPVIMWMTSRSRFKKFFLQYNDLEECIINLQYQDLHTIQSIIEKMHAEKFIKDLTKLHDDIEWELLVYRSIVTLFCIVLIVGFFVI